MNGGGSQPGVQEPGHSEGPAPVQIQNLPQTPELPELPGTRTLYHHQNPQKCSGSSVRRRDPLPGSPLGGSGLFWTSCSALVAPLSHPDVCVTVCVVLPLQMIRRTSGPASSAGTGPRACTMASFPARAARASSSAASATSASTAAAGTRTVRCPASSGTGASTAACSSVCRWG